MESSSNANSENMESSSSANSENMESSSNAECNLCLDSNALRLTTLMAQEGLDATQPATIPNSIW